MVEIFTEVVANCMYFILKYNLISAIPPKIAQIVATSDGAYIVVGAKDGIYMVDTSNLQVIGEHHLDEGLSFDFIK